MSIVGKVALKVWPDLRNFRKELKAEAEKASDGVQVEIEAKFDATQMKQALLKTVREVNASIRGHSAYQVRTSLAVETTAQTLKSLKQSVAAAQAMAKIEKVHIGTTIDGASLSKIPRINVRPAVDQSAWTAFKEALARYDATIRMSPKVDRTALKFAREAMNNAFAERGVKISIDRSSIFGVRQRIEAGLSNILFYIHVKADEARARAEEAKLKKLLGDFTTDIKPRLSSNAVHLVKTELKTLFGEVGVRVKALINPRSVAASVAVLQAAFRDVKVKVKPVIDSKAFAVTMTTLSRITGARLMSKKIMAFDFLKDLDLALPRIGLLSVSIGNLIAAITAGTGAVLAFGRGIAEIGPGALALPGVFAGMATSAISFGLALSEVNQRFPQLSKALTSIKAANNAAFWKEATAGFQALTTSWIPKFRTGMTQVGAASGRVFKDLLASLDRLVTPQLASWFKAVAVGLDSFVKVGGSSGMALMVRGFGDLGAIYFPRMSTWLGKITNQFGTWLTQAVASGDAMTWIDRAVEQLGNLARFAGGLGSILASLSHAATAGGVGLGSMADGIQLAAAALASPQVQFGLIGVFDAAYRAMGNLVTVAGPGVEALFANLATTIPTLLPIIGAVGGQLLGMFAQLFANPATAQGLTDMFLGIQAALTTLQPTVDSLGQAFGGLTTLIGTAFRSIAPLMAVALGGVGEAGHGLLAALNQVVPILMGGFYQAFVAIEPLIRTLTPLVSALVVQVGTALGNALASLAPSLSVLSTGLGVLFGALLPVIGGLVSQLVSGLAPVLSIIFTGLGQIAIVLAPLVTLIGGVLSAVLEIALGALQQVAAVLMPMMVAAIGNLVTALTPLIAGLQAFLLENGPAIQAFLAFLITTIGMAIPGIINGVASVITGVTQTILGIFNLFRDLFTGNWNALGADLMQIVTGLWEVVKGIFEVAINVGLLGIIRKGWVAIKGLFAEGGAGIKAIWDGLWSTLRNAGAAAWDGLVMLARTGWVNIRSTFTNAIGLIRGSWSELWISLRALFDAAWSALMGALRSGVNNSVALFNELPGRFLSALGDLGNLLINSGRSMMDGLARGIRNGIDGAVGAAQNAMDAVRRLFPFSPAKEGPFSGRGWVLYSGMSIADAFAEGIRRRVSAPHSAALDLIGTTRDALESSAIDSPFRDSQIGGAGGGGDSYEFNLTVKADDITQIEELIEWAETLKRRARARGGS